MPKARGTKAKFRVENAYNLQDELNATVIGVSDDKTAAKDADFSIASSNFISFTS